MTVSKESTADPIVIFQEWYNQAQRSGLRRWILSWIYPPAVLHQPDAMTLSTATRDGKPSVRIVLLKGVLEGGFVFYSNYTSRKGRELEHNPVAAAVFHWGFPERQIRVEGTIKKISREDSCAYWKTRPRGSQLSATASEQSSVIPGRSFLEKRVTDFTRKYHGADIPCPETWGGYCLIPERIEFWQGRINRLHDRTCFVRTASGWESICLSP